MSIIIPMLGKSSRFFAAGFEKPKYMLDGRKNSIFYECLYSCHKYFSSERFIFICKDWYATPAFVRQQCRELGVIDFDILIINEQTDGQATTVKLAIDKFNLLQDSITIFNIDTVRHEFAYPKYFKNVDGYVETFKGKGEHWSFFATDEDNIVINAAEKNRISPNCSNGLYFFKTGELFNLAYSKTDWSCVPEKYIAPMYNYLIKKNKLIMAKKIPLECCDFIGTPMEYDLYLTQFNQASPESLIFDLDGTLTIDDPTQSYSDKPVNEAVVNKLRRLKKMGYRIVIFTARNMVTYKCNVNLIEHNTQLIIEKWLDRNSIPYDELIVGKPFCGKNGLYIDDKAINLDDFLAKDFTKN